MNTHGICARKDAKSLFSAGVGVSSRTLATRKLLQILRRQEGVMPCVNRSVARALLNRLGVVRVAVNLSHSVHKISAMGDLGRLYKKQYTRLKKYQNYHILHDQYRAVSLRAGLVSHLWRARKLRR